MFMKSQTDALCMDAKPTRASGSKCCIVGCKRAADVGCYCQEHYREQLRIEREFSELLDHLEGLS